MSVVSDLIEIEVTDDRDETLEEWPVWKVEFERVTEWSYDSDYGADADGRRGMPAYFIDDDRADDIYVDGKPIAEYPEDVRKKIEAAVDEWLDENDPEYQEAEPDYDED